MPPYLAPKPEFDHGSVLQRVLVSVPVVHERKEVSVEQGKEVGSGGRGWEVVRVRKTRQELGITSNGSPFPRVETSEKRRLAEVGCQTKRKLLDQVKRMQTRVARSYVLSEETYRLVRVQGGASVVDRLHPAFGVALVGSGT